MKTSVSILLFFLAATAAAQTDLPRQDFTIQLSESTLIIKPGESKQVTVSIVRSKSFAKGSVKLGLSSVLPQGITLSFEPMEGKFETSVATLSAAPTVVPSNYNIVIKGEMYNKIKGAILRIQVGTETVATK